MNVFFNSKRSQYIRTNFGSHHKLGIEKFLNICWKINPNTGDANFDIDDEKIDPQAPKLFPVYDIPNKLQLFSKKLVDKILSSELKTNIDIYTFTFDMGCLPKHANSVVKGLIKNKRMNSIGLTVNNIHKLEGEHIKLINN